MQTVDLREQIGPDWTLARTAGSRAVMNHGHRDDYWPMSLTARTPSAIMGRGQAAACTLIRQETSSNPVGIR
jgi:hypothetical protein